MTSSSEGREMSMKPRDKKWMPKNRPISRKWFTTRRRRQKRRKNQSRSWRSRSLRLSSARSTRIYSRIRTTGRTRKGGKNWIISWPLWRRSTWMKLVKDSLTKRRNKSNHLLPAKNPISQQRREQYILIILCQRSRRMPLMFSLVLHHPPKCNSGRLGNKFLKYLMASRWPSVNSLRNRLKPTLCKSGSAKLVSL